MSASARLQGTLQLKGECLYVDDTLIVFPELSAHWDAQHQILTYNDKKIALGEEIVIGGGNSQLESETRPVKNLSPSCKQQSVWFAG